VMPTLICRRHGATSIVLALPVVGAAKIDLRAGIGQC
jgi:hypothetical protein